MLPTTTDPECKDWYEEAALTHDVHSEDCWCEPTLSDRGDHYVIIHYDVPLPKNKVN